MNVQSSLFQTVSIEVIGDIFHHALQESNVWEAKLLEGGLFNTTYLVAYGAAHKLAVLRLGPVNRQLLMGLEENLFHAEAYVQSICQSQGLPCAHILACDTSRQWIDRDFMILEYVSGVAMSEAGLAEETRDYLYVQMGQYLGKLHQVVGDCFGFVSRICAGMKFDKWSDALFFELEDITARLEKAGGLAQKETGALREKFYQSKPILDEIKTPHLLHMDLWEGNVLVDRATGELMAVIDCDRAVFGDVDFEFACPWMENPHIRVGYPSNLWAAISPNRAKRQRLYRVFHSLLEAYVGFNEYNDLELYKSRKKQVLEFLSIHD